MDKEQVARNITSLLDLVKEKPKVATLEVTYRDDLIALEVEIVSLNEWMQLSYEVPMPNRRVERHTKEGPVYDYSHPDYQLELRQRLARIKLKRLARCIQATIPGNTNDEQADWLGDNFDEGVLSAISNCLDELHSEGQASIRRVPFHNNGADGIASHGEPAPDA